MFPITSFTASLGNDGNIDIFALALSPQAPQGQGATVFRIQQKKAGGDWRPWANAGKRRQEDQGGAWTGWTSLGAPDAGAIANPALICDSEGYLNLLLTRPANDGMITLRQTANGQFVKGPAIPALPPA